MPTKPIVLLANADTWLTESLESVLTQGGYQVVATAKRQQVLELARRYLPDGILLDTSLDQRTSDNLTLCRTLRADPSISRATPIILLTAGPALRAQQVDALRAGAWELRGDPLDMEELVLRLGVYVQGKLEVDRLGSEGMIDRASGLYNDVGMTRRAAEPAEFTVFAPATDETGAEGLVQRISDAVARTAAVTLRAGVSTAPATAKRPSGARTSTAFPQPAQTSPNELLARARDA